MPQQLAYESPLGLMKISLEKGTTKQIDTQRVATGAHYTERRNWLCEPVIDLLRKYFGSIADAHVLDPFAGNGDMLNAVKELFNSVSISGLDLYADKWIKNDSLKNIPSLGAALICTNPPYLAKYSAKRKGVWPLVEEYFATTKHDDLYLLAIEKMLELGVPVIAIIPETFVTSGCFRDRLERVVVLEKIKPFTETEVPVCVACFSAYKSGDFEYYRDEEFVGLYSSLAGAARVPLDPIKKVSIRFNDPNGLVALKAVDGVAQLDKIRFMDARNFAYSDKKIKVSSRLMTKISVGGLSQDQVGGLVSRANEILLGIRMAGGDAALSPFKGNNKAGVRRRRLDYALARRILTAAMQSGVCGNGVERS